MRQHRRLLMEGLEEMEQQQDTRNWAGVQMPVEITWEVNTQGRGGVTALVRADGSAMIRVFPGMDDTFVNQCPNRELAITWEYARGCEPEPGEKTMCWIAWRPTGRGTMVGFAYFAIGEPVAVLAYRRYSDGSLIVEIK